MSMSQEPARRLDAATAATPDASTAEAKRCSSVLVAALAASAFAALGAWVWRVEGEPLSWDEPAKAAIGDWVAKSPEFAAWAALSDLRLLGLVCISFAAVAIVTKKGRAAAALCCATGAALSSSIFLKAMIDRPRPLGAFELGASFPSTHATAGCAVWVTLALATTKTSPRLRAPAVAAALLAVALSSPWAVVSGRHWPSDLVGGVLLGLVIAILSALVLKDGQKGASVNASIPVPKGEPATDGPLNFPAGD